MGAVNLTFKGFLRAYCRELTGVESDSLRKLLAAVTADSPAAAEAVMVFAAQQEKADYLARLAQGSWVESGYRDFAEGLASCENLAGYLQSDFVPQRYKKVWQAWEAQRAAIAADRRVISIMREKTQAALAQASTTPYAICRQLGLNKGNFYAYLNGGDVTKVSRATARRIMEAALACA